MSADEENVYAKGYTTTSSDRRDRRLTRAGNEPNPTEHDAASNALAGALETGPLADLPNSDRMCVVRQLIDEFPSFSLSSSDDWFSFICKTSELLSLELTTPSHVYVLLLSKLPANYRPFWLGVISRKAPWEQIIHEIWDTFVSKREFDRLVSSKLKRGQYSHENPRDYFHSLVSANRALGNRYDENRLLELLIEGLNPITESALLFRQQPTTLLEMERLMNHASKRLMTRAEFFNSTFHPRPTVNSPQPSQVSRTCNYCLKRGHSAEVCRKRIRDLDARERASRLQLTLALFDEFLTIPRVPVQVHGAPCQALLDTGSTLSLLNETFWNAFPSKPRASRVQGCHKILRTISGGEVILTTKVSLRIKIKSFSWTHHFYLTSLCPTCLLGQDFISKASLIIHPDGFAFANSPSRKYSFCYTTHDGETSAVDSKVKDDSSTDNEDFSQSCVATSMGTEEHSFSALESQSGAHSPTPTNTENQLKSLLSRFPDVICARLGATHVLKYDLEVNAHSPIRSTPYSLSPPKLIALKQHLRKLMDEGIIEPSFSQWSSPAFLIPKKDGTERLVVDYRRLNKLVKVDNFPTPNVENAFQYLSQAKYFTVIDLKSAFHQIPLSDPSKQYTAFVTQVGLFQFNRLPFGLTVSPQVFCRLMDLVLEDLKYSCVYPYVDDLCIYSRDFEQHLRDVEAVLNKLRAAGLTVHPDKLKLAQRSIAFLGHIISNGTLSVDEERTKAVREFPTPKTVKQVARFLGMCGFYSKFIPNYAEVSAPLNRLKRKGAVFQWSDEQSSAFLQLKRSLANPPVLCLPDFQKEFHVYVDASQVALGAVLNQSVDGELKPVAYASRTLNEHERNLPSYELECMSCCWAVEKFRSYLQFKTFHLYTDNNALTWLFKHPKQLGKVGRMVLKLSAFRFVIHHVRGQQNCVADCLSRPTESGATASHISLFLNLIPMSFVNIREHQCSDPSLKTIIEDLRKDPKSHPGWTLKDNLLCHASGRCLKLKIVVPPVLRPMLFQYFHDLPSGGHMGITKTCEKIGRQFWWHNWRKEVTDMVKRCHSCQLSKPLNRLPQGKMSSVLSTYPWERIYVDFVGPLPRSKNGNEYAFTIIDSFSKFTVIEPIRSATASLVVNLLSRKIFPKFGYPKFLVSDNGSAFKARVFRDMMFKLGVSHVCTSPYYPKANQAERVHRNLKIALSSLCENSHNKWEEFLPELCFAFNSAVHSSTGYSPAKVFLGRELPHPLSNVWEIPPEIFDDNGDVKEMSFLWSKVLSNLKNAHQRQSAKFNKLHSEVLFKVGDQVLLKTHHLSSKLKRKTAKLYPKWEGPFPVVKMLTPVTVVLKVSPKKERIAHVAHLKAYRN
jgi:hypothetical protein